MNRDLKKIIIDGRFLQQRLTGVQRFAVENLKRLAKRSDLSIIVAVPPAVTEFPVTGENLVYEKIGTHSETRWEQFDLARYCKKKKLPLLCLCNTAPMRYRATVVLHDIYWLDTKKSETDFKHRLKSKLMIRSFIYKNKGLFTVSEFSAQQIKARFPRTKPVVLCSGWEHVQDWEETPVEGIPTSFYLSVGSLKPNKNFNYILHLAKNSPDQNFVIVGEKSGQIECYLNKNGLKNCHFTGYLSDGQIKWLYARCEGFILPSLYEGFGLPPLEAVACGCKKLFLSDIPVFREIYGGAANFFDPLDFEHTANQFLGRLQHEKSNHYGVFDRNRPEYYGSTASVS